MSKPAISKHLWVLEETGALRRTIEGRTHWLLIQPGVLSEAASGWIVGAPCWGRLFDVVDEYLKEDRPR